MHIQTLNVLKLLYRENVLLVHMLNPIWILSHAGHTIPTIRFEKTSLVKTVLTSELSKDILILLLAKQS